MYEEMEDGLKRDLLFIIQIKNVHSPLPPPHLYNPWKTVIVYTIFINPEKDDPLTCSPGIFLI